MAESRPPPTGKTRRFLKLGALTTKVAASYLGSSVAGLFRSKAGREQAERRTHARNAERLAGVMTELKGAVMKIGQLLSTQDGIVPQELRDTLSQFHCQAPPMHWLYVKDIVEEELEGAIDERFESFSREPLAAASLGQVHRARLRTGDEVCVKVQYPGIHETIESDLANLRRVVRSMRLAGSAFDLSEAFDEVRETLLREADYEREADAVERFGRALEGAERVSVPQVYRSHSTRRVITLEYLSGRHLDDFVATQPERAVRDALGRRLARTIWELEFQHGLLHADPHPGNYLFMDDERLGVLDFGCVKIFEPAFLAAYREAIAAILDRDDERMVDAYLRMGLMKPEQCGTKLERAYIEWSYLSCEPLLHDGVWEGDWEAFLKALHDRMNAMALELGFYIPKDAVYLNRVMLGVMCFWNRLDVRLDWGALIHEVLAAPVAEPG